GSWFAALFIAAMLTATGAAAPPANHACSDARFLQSWRSANALFTTAASLLKRGSLVPAAANVQRARSRVQSAPLPCTSTLLLARTSTLKEYANTMQALRADADGDYSSADNYLQHALHEQDVVVQMISRWESEHPSG